MDVQIDAVVYDEDDGIYKAVLNDGVELYFDENGEWRRVYTHKNELSAAEMNFLPQKAQEYMKENAGGKRIRKMKRSRRGFFTVQFSDRSLLHFSKTGKFLPNDVQQLPSQTRALLTSHFAEDSVESATVDVDREYSVELKSGIALEFDKYGVFDRIDAVKGQGVPAAFMATFPKPMVKYLAEKHAGKLVKRIVRKDYGYYVRTEKPAMVELCFSKNGHYIRNAGSGDGD